MSGPMAEVRARAGDRDRSGLMLRDSRWAEMKLEGGQALCQPCRMVL